MICQHYPFLPSPSSLPDCKGEAANRTQRETINKLLKKQAPKTNKRAAAADEETPDDANRPDPTIIRWVSDRNGSKLSLPDELVKSRAGAMFRPTKVGKMVKEVQ